MTGWSLSLLLLAFGGPGWMERLVALHSRGAEYLLLVLTLVIVSLWGLVIFVTGLISLLGTRRFLRKAAFAKGHVSDIYDVVPAGESDQLFPCRIVTVQFWTEQEEAVEFQSHTFQGNPETATGLLPVCYDPAHPSEAKISSFEGLWLISGLLIATGVGFSLLCTGVFVSIMI
ncbi:hypothetical protein Krac_7477 [Ktedonobacter racemifer DSM 44963]|uniref:DUF3592 domain-containing protein n=1 Tax=Ktedonobacter racemifer DSM 44963 TaxID=485913 RepID=D6TK88_KTERA|nr:hypothetical protein Krac_7477 [Ktedonobacter racemifer DSM 44963]